eukprot:7103375-Pyramimonas_sp.AAC.1
MDGGWFSRFRSCCSAARIRFQSLQHFQGCRVAHFRNGDLTLALREFVLNICDSFKDSYG